MRRFNLFFLAATIGIFICFAGCPPPKPVMVEQNVTEEGGTLSLQGATLEIPPDALPQSALLAMEDNAEDEEVELGQNETPISDIFTLTNDQGAVLDCAASTFKLTLPFDAAALGKATPNEVQVFAKVAVDDDVFTMMGTIVGNSITLALYGLPIRANYQVVYNPNREALFDDEPGKTLTDLSPWETTTWAIHYDAKADVIRQAVATARGVPVATLTIDMIRQTIREKIKDVARDASVYYSSIGLREPNIALWTHNDGSKRFVLHLTNLRNFYRNPTLENGIGQINIAAPVMGWNIDYFLGTSKNAVSHEMFHACVNGYELKMGKTPEERRAFNGYNEGMATVMGHTFDHDGVISARENHVDHNYTMILSQPLGDCVPREAAYTNNDFFAYFAKRFAGNSMNFLVGTGVDQNGDKNGILEQTHKYLLADTELLPYGSPYESYLYAYRVGLHRALKLQFDMSAADAYWDFAKNRAYENNEHSLMRSGDTATRWELHSDRFDASAVYQHTFASADETLPLSYNSISALNDIVPFSTRALVFNANGFDSKLTLTFQKGNWFPDDFGNSLRVKIYKAGEDGTELPAGEDTFSIEGFGADFNQVIVLIANVSVDGSYSIIMSAKTEPNEEPGPCAPNGTVSDPWDRWLIEYDYDCNETWDSDVLWHFLDDGTISHHWLGVISGYTWTVQDNKMIISFGPDQGGMEATFSEDCENMEDGVFVGDFANPTCWRARQY